jgi:iron-sulfur cluster repair protein YtfE (RIC family)
MNITVNTQLRRVIRFRPLAIALLERESAFHCWEHLDQPLGRFCADRGLNAESLAQRLNALPPVSQDTEWKTMPLYYLIDHLTRNHAEFRERDMPSIALMLEEQRLPAYPDGYVVKLLIQEFRYFQQEFIKHMDEEETFLFPKILRNEACFRHPKMGPEIHKGSVNLFLKLETHKPEVEFKRMLAAIREKLRNQLLQQPAADLAQRVTDALETFEKKLLAHADLESDVLFPLAGRMEQELYESSAPGMSRFPGDQ